MDLQPRYMVWAMGFIQESAYGMVYEHNQDTYVYAINADTGELVWRAKGPGIGYSNTLSIADGKVYVQMGEYQYRDFETGEYAYPEYNCYDAYTGELIWTFPMENNAPFNSQVHCIWQPLRCSHSRNAIKNLACGNTRSNRPP